MEITPGKVVFSVVSMSAVMAFFAFGSLSEHSSGQTTPGMTICAIVFAACAVLAGILGPRVLSTPDYWVRLSLGMGAIAAATAASVVLPQPGHTYRLIYGSLLWVLPLCQGAWALAAIVWRPADSVAIQRIRRQVQQQMAVVVGPVLNGLLVAIKVLVAAILATIPWLILLFYNGTCWWVYVFHSSDDVLVPMLFLLLFVVAVKESVEMSVWVTPNPITQIRLIIAILGPMMVLPLLIIGIIGANEDLSRGVVALAAAGITAAVVVHALIRAGRLRQIDLPSLRMRIIEICRQDPSASSKAFLEPIPAIARATPDALVIEGLERRTYPWASIRNLVTFREQTRICRIVTSDGRSEQASIVRPPAYLAHGQLEEVWAAWLEHIDPNITEFHALPPSRKDTVRVTRMIVASAVIYWILLTVVVIKAQPTWQDIASRMAVSTIVFGTLIFLAVWVPLREAKHSLASIRLVDDGAEITLRNGKKRFIAVRDLLPRRDPKWILCRRITENRTLAYSLSHWPLLRKKLLDLAAGHNAQRTQDC